MTDFTKELTETLNFAPHMNYIGGDSGILGLKINENDYSDVWMSVTINERLNEAPTATITLSTDPSMSADITNYKLVRIYYDSTEIFKGYIQKIDYNSDEKSTLHCIQAAAVKLMNYFVGVGSGATENQGYRKSSTAVNTMVSNLISIDYTGTSKDIVDDGTNDFTTSVNFYVEGVNRLQALRKLARHNGCELWFGVDGSDNDQLNFSDERGTGSTVKTFYTHGSNMNCDAINRRKDTTMLWNAIKVAGFGDGDRQAMSINTDTTTASDTLNGAITAADTTITLNSSSGFTATGGVILIESEIIEYTGVSGADLTGCIRGTHGTDEAIHANSTAVVEHPYYEVDATSQSAYGIRQKRWVDKAVKNYAEANTLAGKILADHKDPINRFTIKTYDLDEILPSVVSVGDTITISDNSIFQSGDATTYKVMSRTIRINAFTGEEIVLECASRTYTFIEEMQEVFEEANDMGVMQQINEIVKAFLDNAGTDNFLDNAAVAAFLNNTGVAAFLNNTGTDSFLDGISAANFLNNTSTASGVNGVGTGVGEITDSDTGPYQSTAAATNTHANTDETGSASLGTQTYGTASLADAVWSDANLTTTFVDIGTFSNANVATTDYIYVYICMTHAEAGARNFFIRIDQANQGTRYFPHSTGVKLYCDNGGGAGNTICAMLIIPAGWWSASSASNKIQIASGTGGAGIAANGHINAFETTSHRHDIGHTDIVTDSDVTLQGASAITTANAAPSTTTDSFLDNNSVASAYNDSSQAAGLNNTSTANALNNTSTANALNNTSVAAGLNNTSTDNAIKKITG